MKKLILITGMSGSGKTTLAEMFEEEGHTVITMGDVIRDLASESGLEPTPTNLGVTAKEIRREGGEAAVAERCVDKLNSLDKPVIVVDGIRSISEVDVFKASFDASLVAIHAPPETRYVRLRDRRRSDDPVDRKTFRERDLRELGFSLGWAIAFADHMIVNEGTLGELGERYRALKERLGLE
ncbi:MAG: AAA family ATPase [Candidatus Bathyarchaeota archaeon]|nr:MAG: AAA family ATPase [Candidatus Bathyarchaeota archaeon]